MSKLHTIDDKDRGGGGFRQVSQIYLTTNLHIFVILMIIVKSYVKVLIHNYGYIILSIATY